MRAACPEVKPFKDNVRRSGWVGAAAGNIVIVALRAGAVAVKIVLCETDARHATHLHTKGKRIYFGVLIVHLNGQLLGQKGLQRRNDICPGDNAPVGLDRV